MKPLNNSYINYNSILILSHNKDLKINLLNNSNNDFNNIHPNIKFSKYFVANNLSFVSKPIFNINY